MQTGVNPIPHFFYYHLKAISANKTWKKGKEGRGRSRGRSLVYKFLLVMGDIAIGVGPRYHLEIFRLMFQKYPFLAPISLFLIPEMPL